VICGFSLGNGINWENPWLERNRLKPFRTAYFRYQYATVFDPLQRYSLTKDR
jgi:hypothetical protein